jgi:hypothetical protein
MATFAPNRIVTPDPALSQTAVCLRVHLGALGNTRKVSSANVEVDADKQLIRVSKRLLDAVELRDIHRSTANCAIISTRYACLSRSAFTYCRSP